MKIHVGTDGEGGSIYRAVVDTPIQEIRSKILEQEYLLSRRSQESLLSMCHDYEQILRAIYRELSNRALKNED